MFEVVNDYPFPVIITNVDFFSPAGQYIGPLGGQNPRDPNFTAASYLDEDNYDSPVYPVRVYSLAGSFLGFEEETGDWTTRFDKDVTFDQLYPYDVNALPPTNPNMRRTVRLELDSGVEIIPQETVSLYIEAPDAQIFTKSGSASPNEENTLKLGFNSIIQDSPFSSGQDPAEFFGEIQ